MPRSSTNPAATTRSTDNAQPGFSRRPGSSFLYGTADHAAGHLDSRRLKCRSVNRLRSEKERASPPPPGASERSGAGREDVKTNSPRVRMVSKTEAAATIGDSVRL